MFPFDNSPMRKRLLLEQNWLSTVIYMHNRSICKYFISFHHFAYFRMPQPGGEILRKAGGKLGKGIKVSGKIVRVKYELGPVAHVT